MREKAIPPLSIVSAGQSGDLRKAYRSHDPDCEFSDFYNSDQVRKAVQVKVFRRWFKVYGYCDALNIEVVGRSKKKVWLELLEEIRNCQEETEKAIKKIDELLAQ